MTERLDKAKKYVELYIESMNKHDIEGSVIYGSRAVNIFNVIKIAGGEEEDKDLESLVNEMLSAYFSAHLPVDREKCISYLSGKLSEETCKDLTKLLLEKPYWLYFQHLGYGMTIRNILREVCDDFETLEYLWERILIVAIKRKLDLNEKLPLKCWPCKWNDRCGDKVCQPIYNEDRSGIICNYESDLYYEGSNGLTYEKELRNKSIKNVVIIEM